MAREATRRNQPKRTGTHRKALEVWLDESARVLADQREHSISPSFAAAIAADRPYESVLDMVTLEVGLAHLLAMLSADPGRWILIIEHREGAAMRYLQYLLFEDGSLVAETVSNEYLEEPHLLSAEDEAVLVALGWNPPRPADDQPNWGIVEDTINPDLEAAARLGIATLRAGFSALDDDLLKVIMFSSPNREKTPASFVDSPDTDEDGSEYICTYPVGDSESGWNDGSDELPVTLGADALSDLERSPNRCSASSKPSATVFRE